MDELLADAIRAFRLGQAWAAVRFRVRDRWQDPFLVPVPSPAAMAAVGDQYRFVGADALCLASRARVVVRGVTRDVAVVTELPAQRQEVRDLDCGQVVSVPFLRDDGLVALETRLGMLSESVAAGTAW